MEQSVPPSLPTRISLIFIGYLLFFLQCTFLLRRKLILSFFCLAHPACTVSIIPRPSAIYLMMCNALPGNFIGASRTTCSDRLILVIILPCYFITEYSTQSFSKNASTKAFSLSHAFTHSMISPFICEVYGKTIN